jgi:hypothetical protein
MLDPQLFLPETAQTHCYFKAPSRSAVRIPFTQMIDAMEMTAPSRVTSRASAT